MWLTCFWCNNWQITWTKESLCFHIGGFVFLGSSSVCMYRHPIVMNVLSKEYLKGIPSNLAQTSTWSRSQSLHVHPVLVAHSCEHDLSKTHSSNLVHFWREWDIYEMPFNICVTILIRMSLDRHATAMLLVSRSIQLQHGNLTTGKYHRSFFFWPFYCQANFIHDNKNKDNQKPHWLTYTGLRIWYDRVGWYINIKYGNKSS